MKIIYQDKHTKNIRKLRKNAFRLREKFIEGEPINVLRSHFEILEETFNELTNDISPEFKPISELGRHIYWTGRNLSDGKPDSCIHDVIQICDTDIDAFEDSYIQYQQRLFLNKDIPDSILKLLAEENNDSAVRKAFIILTEKLRSKFNIPQNTDGKDLINSIFGKSGQASIAMPSDHRESLRDLLSGMYGVFRNRYMHSNQVEWSYEADIIVGMINILIYRIDSIDLSEVKTIQE